ncbi:porphobilinogen synthase [Gottfriedia acidiceleris]|uniref:porphobilinogen synthase n=1 Tax=Gottfriedia acidiceleris TaxID=371036 RepID=UPI000B450D6B|nr:porphobilinogen synthase [Gottfriedia acidiceleris]
MNEINFKRHRSLRSSVTLRDMVRENSIELRNLIQPIFVVEGKNIKEEIKSMPGIYRFSLDTLIEEVKLLNSLGIKSIILFGIPNEKDDLATSAYNEVGIVQKAIRVVKEHCNEMVVIADTCICHYTNSGHCGILENGKILNDESLLLHGKVAVSQAEAGVDIVAPSSMMDGYVTFIRKCLDENGYEHIPIMSYGVKFSSAFYGPFRDAADNAPHNGDRKTYQMDPANRLEALRELESDIKEGTDFMIVKPALAYLDIIRDIRNNCNLPIVAYHVSGEYSLIKAASMNGWVNEKEIVLESLLSMKRAGANLIISYYAKSVAQWYKNQI